MSLAYKKENAACARSLRKNATPQEKRLWYDFLSTYPVRFQRQKRIGDYIADFYCHKAKLVIELDGSQHYTEAGMEKDSIRTEILTQFGLQVIRFTNGDVDAHFEGVCHIIDATVKKAVNKE